MVPRMPRGGRVSAHLIAGAAAAACLSLGGVIGLSVVAAAGTPAPTTLAVCATSGPLAGLSDAQAQNARTIVAVAAPRGGRSAAVLAVMTAITESNLLILGNPNDPNGMSLPNQGIGTDHDSIGLFQQRPPWGSASQRMDPIASTNLFLDSLLAVPGWERLDPWVAAQTVQRSAFSAGENYRAHLGAAKALTDTVIADPRGHVCEAGPAGTPPPDAGKYGLPKDFTLPAGTSPAARQAVAYALAQLGKPYIYGGTGPRGYDCSGLMQMAWSAAGVRISRVTTTQMRDGIPVDAAHLAPGDLVLIPGSDGTLAAPGHVGMYIGTGLVIAAPYTGEVVRISTFASFVGGGISTLRHIG